VLEKLKVKNIILNVRYILRLGLFYPVTATTVVCCILMQILCVVSQNKLKLLGDFIPRPPLGLHSWTPLGDFYPPDPQSSFMSPQ